MLIKDRWYVATHADALIVGGVLARTICGDDIVFCRRRDGSVFALEDRCAHRAVPLSLGEMDGDVIRCGYHGACFDGSGKCVAVPGQSELPPAGAVRSYPVHERYGFIWVWPGDVANPPLEPRLPGFLAKCAPPFETRNGEMISFKADYRLIVDNLLDLTHGQYVHRKTFGLKDLSVARSIEQEKRPETANDFKVDFRDDGIDFRIHLNNTDIGRGFVAAYDMKHGLDPTDRPMDMHMDVSWAAPHLFSFDLVVKRPEDARDIGVGTVATHLLTPENETTTHYFFRSSVYQTGGKAGVADYAYDFLARAFLEDKRILEAQQRRIGARDLIDTPIAHFQGDMIVDEGRRILRRLEAAAV